MSVHRRPIEWTHRAAYASNYFLGVDEVGRGALAGPILAVCCGVCLKEPFNPEVNDSKSLQSSKRRELRKWIKAHHILSYAALSNEDIDRWGVGFCNKEVLKRAVMNHPWVHAKKRIAATCVDGTIKISLPTELNEVTLVQGDAKSYAVGCASIVAKCLRDYLMCRLHRMSDQYGYEHHKGYGTASHREAIQRHGMSSWHRRSFCQAINQKQSTLF